MIRFFLPACLALTTGCSTDKPDSGKLESSFIQAAIVDSLVAEVLEPGGPGCVVAIFRDQQIAFERGYGVANLDYGLPVNSATVFDIASISKQFTAACILILAERNQLTLDDDIRKFIPEFPDYGPKIEIRRLLNHTSGVRDWVWLLTLGGVPFENAITRQELFELIYRQKDLAFAPGSDFAYSNSAFNLLSLIIERVSGMPLSRFVSREIFEPLGMNNSCVFDNRRMVVKNRALGYIPDEGDGWLMEHYFNPVFTGSSNIHSTVGDLLLWDRNFYTADVGPPGMAASMEKAGELNNGEAIRYGLGLWVGEYRGLRTAGHDGDWAGSYAYMLRFPDQHFTVLCLANTHTFSPRRMCYKIADLCLAQWYAMELPEQDRVPAPGVPVEPDPSLYDVYAGEYVTESGRKLSLRRENEILTGRFPGRRKFELLPLSATEFFPEGDNATLSVIRDGAGAVERIEWKSGEKTTTYYDSPYRFSQYDISGKGAEYEGEYYSEDLKAKYRIESADRGLLLISPIKSRYMMELTGITGNDPLVALAKDSFRFAFFEIKFRRDKQGRVSGYTLIHPWASLRIEFAKLELLLREPGHKSAK